MDRNRISFRFTVVEYEGGPDPGTEHTTRKTGYAPGRDLDGIDFSGVAGDDADEIARAIAAGWRPVLPSAWANPSNRWRVTVEITDGNRKPLPRRPWRNVSRDGSQRVRGVAWGSVPGEKSYLFEDLAEVLADWRAALTKALRRLHRVLRSIRSKAR